MKKNTVPYEPPKGIVYPFDDNDRILTTPSGAGGSESTDPPKDYAANALNDFMGGTNTTIERYND